MLVTEGIASSLCLGKDATFEIHVINDTAPYGNGLLWLPSSSLFIYSCEVTPVHDPRYREVRGQGSLQSNLSGAYRDSMMRPSQQVFVVMKVLPWEMVS